MSPQTFIDFIEDFLKHVHATDFGGEKKLGLVGCGHSGCYSMEVVNKNQELFHKVMFTNFGYLGGFAHVKSLLIKKGKQWMIPTINVLLAIFYRLYVTPVIGPAFHKSMSSPAQMKKNLISHVFVNESSITDELVQEMHELAVMKRPIYLQPAFMLGHLDPYKSN